MLSAFLHFHYRCRRLDDGSWMGLFKTFCMAERVLSTSKWKPLSLWEGTYEKFEFTIYLILLYCFLFFSFVICYIFSWSNNISLLFYFWQIFYYCFIFLIVHLCFGLLLFVLPFYMLLQVNRHINNKLEWYELALLKKNEEERMVGFCFINLGFSFLCIYVYIFTM